MGLGKIVKRATHTVTKPVAAVAKPAAKATKAVAKPVAQVVKPVAKPVAKATKAIVVPVVKPVRQLPLVGPIVEDLPAATPSRVMAGLVEVVEPVLTAVTPKQCHAVCEQTAKVLTTACDIAEIDDNFALKCIQTVAEDHASCVAGCP